MNNLTEEEAKNKWCPHVRIDMGASVVANYYNSDDFVSCIGAECMMWRWLPLTVNNSAFIKAAKKVAIEIGDNTTSRSKAVAYVHDNRAKYGLPAKPYLGHCGLAGPT